MEEYIYKIATSKAKQRKIGFIILGSVIFFFNDDSNRNRSCKNVTG